MFADEETVAPPLPQAPSIVVQPSVVVTGFEARITAIINPNGIETHCYFEYGPTPANGMRTPSKSAGAGGSEVVVRNTLRGLPCDTTYHCRLVAENSAGTVTGSDRTFIIPSGLPVVASEVSIAPNGLRVVVTGTVNANGKSTIYFFEYGQTTAYGIQRPTKSIGSGASDIFVSDTITVPAPGVTIHCRLVSVNSNGRSVSADKAFTIYEFVYPLTVGTRWWYRYHHYQFNSFTSRSGNQIWEVIALPTSSSARIQVSRVDTVLQTAGHPNIQQSVTSFDVTLNEQSYVVPWNQLLVEPGVVIANYITVPRYVPGITTVVLGHGFNGSTACSCEYADGKGLVSYSWNHIPTQYAYEWLILDSLKVAP